MMGGYGAGLGGGWGWGMGYGMGLGWIVPLLVIGLVVWAVIAFTRSRSDGADSAAPDRSLAILKERFAKGELDNETFQRMRKELDA